MQQKFVMGRNRAAIQLRLNRSSTFAFISGDSARRVVEHGGRAFGESLRTASMLSRCGSVLAQRRKSNFAGVVHVHVVVHHHEVFGEHHLAHAPEAVLGGRPQGLL